MEVGVAWAVSGRRGRRGGAGLAQVSVVLEKRHGRRFGDQSGTGEVVRFDALTEKVTEVDRIVVFQCKVSNRISPFCLSSPWHSKQ